MQTKLEHQESHPAESSLFITFTLAGRAAAASRLGAKILVTSLFRTLYSGRLVLFHPTEVPLFAQKRETCDEYHVPQLAELSAKNMGSISLLWESLQSSGIDYKSYDNIILCTPTAVALRNIDHFVSNLEDFAQWRGQHLIVVAHSTRVDSFISTVFDRAQSRGVGRDGLQSVGGLPEPEEVAFEAARDFGGPPPCLAFAPCVEPASVQRWQTLRYLEAFHYRSLEELAKEAIF